MKDAIVASRFEPDVARPVAVGAEPADRVTLFADQRYMAGPKPMTFMYEGIARRC